MEEAWRYNVNSPGARGQAYCLNHPGLLHQSLGCPDRALPYLQEALALRREFGEPYGQAESLRDLGVTLHAAGREAEARQHWLEALAIFDRLRPTDADHVRGLLHTLPGNLRDGVLVG